MSDSGRENEKVIVGGANQVDDGRPALLETSLNNSWRMEQDHFR